MGKKQLGNKVHKIRRAFIVSTILAGILALGVGFVAGTAAKPVILTINGCLLAGTLGLSVGLGVALNKAYEAIAVKVSKDFATKALEEIKSLNNERSSEHSTKYRTKILRKYANANLVLTRCLGATIFGEYRTTSNMGEKGTELINMIDAYHILKNTSTSPREIKKYEKKIKLAESQLTKVQAQEGAKVSKCKWTRSYEDVVPGVTALDRRTEISCLTPTARDSFRALMERTIEFIDDTCVNVSMSFKEGSGISPCIARAEDQTKAISIKEILLKDAYEACKDKSQVELRTLFPIVIETKLINKNTTELTNSSVFTVSSFSELKKLVEPETTK